MAPKSSALKQSAYPFIMQYAAQGCEVSFIREWTKTEIVTEVNRGPHPSERIPDATAELKKEAK